MSDGVMGVLQSDGSWRITEVDWPRSRRWDTPWTVRNGSWGQRPDPIGPVTRQAFHGGAWVTKPGGFRFGGPV